MRITSILLALVLTLAACAGPRHGPYFDRSGYRPLPLPTAHGARGHIPKPVLADEDVIKLHKFTWKLYFRHLRWPRQGTGFPSDYVDEAFNPHLFQWDTAFMMMFGRYTHSAFPAIVSLDNFYAKQHIDGYICRELDERTGADFVHEGLVHTINPPLFAWAEWEYYRVTADASRFPRILEPLVRYHEWLRANRRNPDGTYWNTGLGSGMDNTPREGEGWICMTAQQALACRCIARIANQVGRLQIGSRFQAEYEGLKKLINTSMWDPDDGFYYDLKGGKPSRVKTPASFWVLVAGVASKQRAEAMAKYLRDPKVFKRAHMVPTLSADHEKFNADGDYWCGAVWAPTNYAVVTGLAEVGLHDLAREIAENHLANMVEVYKETETIWENYAPDAAGQGDPARRDFVGWSGLGPTAMLYEHVLGLEADGPGRTLTWRIHRLERHGIEQFTFGGVRVDVIAQAREEAGDKIVIEVTASGPFTLKLIRPDGREKQSSFAAGRHTWEIEP